MLFSHWKMAGGLSYKMEVRLDGIIVVVVLVFALVVVGCVGQGGLLVVVGDGTGNNNRIIK